jgi:uncharacterized protein (TIGR02611 family)
VGDGYPTGGPSSSGNTPLKSGWRARILAVRARMRSTLLGRVTFAVLIAMFGGLVVIVGLVLVPLPGPGWLIVAAGVGIWAVEFHWARRLLGLARRAIHRWSRWVRGLPRTVRTLLGLAATVVIVTVAWLSLRLGFNVDLGIDLAERLWR